MRVRALQRRGSGPEREHVFVVYDAEGLIDPAARDIGVRHRSRSTGWVSTRVPYGRGAFEINLPISTYDVQLMRAKFSTRSYHANWNF
eukprot:SAG11_NODE_22502_length_405_cov_0.624183_1_plen_87_part_10